jgi:hypothetical protein
MSEYSNQRRDKAIAKEVQTGDVGYTPDQMCSAKGCPNRWSVDAGKGKLCSAHHSVDDKPHLWPQITQEERDLEVMRAQHQPAPKAPPLTREDKLAILERLRTVTRRMSGDGPADPKAWARALMRAEEEGERLTFAQRTMWRAALPEVSDA